MSKATEGRRVEREARLRWVPITLMRVSPLAQRDLNQAWVDRLVANFDLEQLGTPTINHRDGVFYVIDGQHRIAALKEIGWGDQQVQCWTYDGLSEQAEAETFLKLQERLTPTAFAKFRVSVQAGRQVECDIDRIVRACGLRVSQDKVEGAIQAVGTLRRVYERANGATLARTLRLISDAYGDAGLEAAVIDGLALLCQRYDGDLDQAVAVQKLSSVNGGVNGLLNKAEVLRRQTGNQKGHCVAAAAVEIINAGRGGKKLASWWREDAA